MCAYVSRVCMGYTRHFVETEYCSMVEICEHRLQTISLQCHKAVPLHINVQEYKCTESYPIDYTGNDRELTQISFFPFVHLSC